MKKIRIFKKKKRIIAMMTLVFMFLFSAMPVMAAGSIKSVSPEAAESVLDDLDSSSVIIKGNDGTYYYGEAKDFFSWLKNRHSGETFTGPKSDKYSTWGEVDDNLSDGIDSNVFAGSILSKGGIAMLVMRNTVANVLKLSVSEFEFIAPFIDFMKPIGFTLCMLYLALAIIDMGEKDLRSQVAWMMMFFKFGTGIAFVYASDILATLGFLLSNGFVDMFLGTNLSELEKIAVTENRAVAVAMNCDTDGIFASLALFIGQAVNMFLSQVLTIIVTLLLTASCYARKLEFAIRSVFLPIGIANVAGKGAQGPGMRYFLKLLSCGLQAGGIVFLVSFSQTVNVPDGVAFSGVMIPIAILGSTTLAKKIADEALGA